MNEVTAYVWLGLTVLVVIVLLVAYKRRPGPPS